MKHRCFGCERKKHKVVAVNWHGDLEQICFKCYAVFNAGFADARRKHESVWRSEPDTAHATRNLCSPTLVCVNCATEYDEICWARPCLIGMTHQYERMMTKRTNDEPL